MKKKFQYTVGFFPSAVQNVRHVHVKVWIRSANFEIEINFRTVARKAHDAEMGKNVPQDGLSTAPSQILRKPTWCHC
jgi:hypothetical protein